MTTPAPPTPEELGARLDRIAEAVAAIRGLVHVEAPHQKTARTRAINNLAREARDLYRVNAGLPPLE